MEDINYLRVLLAFLFVIALIGAMHFLLKRLNLQKRLYAGKGGARLAVTESLMIDPRHKMILVRRDDKEHLLLLGTQQDLVIETGIETGMDTDVHTDTKGTNAKVKMVVTGEGNA